MIIGERLRALREQKNFSRAILRKGPDCSVAMFPESKTATPSLPSRRWRSLLAPSKSRCINFFTREKSHPSYQISRSAKVPPTSHGAIRGKILECWRSSAASSATWRKVT